MNKVNLKPLAITFLMLMFLCIGMGVYKMYKNKNQSDEYSINYEYVNTYGSTYHYMKNAGLTNTCFNLAILNAVLAIGIFTLDSVRKRMVIVDTEYDGGILNKDKEEKTIL